MRWRSLLRQPVLLVWATYIFLIPLYIFKSGLPQPGDMFVVILVPVALRGWNGRLNPHARATFRPLLWFTIWVCAVDYTWAILEGKYGIFGTDTFMLFPLYYVYNALVFLVALVLYQRYGDKFLRITLDAVTATVLVQVFASLVLGSAGRSTLFFNNPNQLGYYALLAGTLIALSQRRLKSSVLMSSIALTACGYLALTSGSRAAVAGIAMLFALVVFANPRLVILVCVAASGLLLVGGPIARALEAYQERAELRAGMAREGFLEERGYDRVWEHEEYLVLGAGEGAFDRFNDGRHGNMELHSTPGTLLFCYGIVGTSIFLLWLWRVVRGARFRAALMLAPPLLYTVAHQGLRFTMFWVLAAMFVVLKDVAAARQPERRTAPAIAA